MRSAGFLVFVILSLIELRTSSSADDTLEFQKTLPPPVMVWALKGHNVELPCDVSLPTPEDRINMILWFKDTTGIPFYSLDARDSELYKAEQMAVSRWYFKFTKSTGGKLMIANVLESDKGVYRCRIDFSDSPTRNFRVQLSLVDPPESIFVMDSQGVEVHNVAGPYFEGYDLQLSCTVKGGRPKPSVSWWMNGTKIDDFTEQVFQDQSTNRLLIPVVTRDLWQAVVECRASSTPSIPAQIKTIQLDVYLKPLTIKIVQSGSRELSVGRSHQIQCESVGSVPAANITWFLDGDTIKHSFVTVMDGTERTVSNLTLQVDAHDHGKELTCRAENSRMYAPAITHSIRLNVTYPPILSVKPVSIMDLDQIREGDDLQLNCKVDANPPIRYINWYHGSQVISTTSEVRHQDHRRLFLTNLNASSSGEYVCVASNSEGVSRSVPYNLKLLHTPECAPGTYSTMIGALRHETVEVKCAVKSNPESGVKFSWTYNNSRETLPIPGSRVSSDGLTSSVQYTPITESDFGTLACWASNQIGKQRVPCYVHIVQAKTPDTPANCSLNNETSIITCSPGYDGGLKQYFLMEVRNTEDPIDNEVDTPPYAELPQQLNDQDSDGGTPALYRIRNDEALFSLDSLDTDYTYDLYLFAVNAKGKSEPYRIPNVKMRSSQKLPRTNKDPSSAMAQVSPLLIFIGISGSVLAIIALVVVTGIILLCRKKDQTTPPLRRNSQRSTQRNSMRGSQLNNYGDNIFIKTTPMSDAESDDEMNEGKI
uniref:Hemicentin-2 n=1 Tax=Cacopsylla melanoneura TaxID=428564 RepID=A0A8D8YTR6_9HEMI